MRLVLSAITALILAACMTDPESRLPAQNPKRLFVTSTLHTGDLGGLAGADSICLARASEANLGGEWVAFLSDSLTWASDRISESDSWRSVNDSTEIFWHNQEFTQRARSSIHDEQGDPVPGGQAWTGTRADGLPEAGHHCANWTSSSQSHFGAVGEPVHIDADDGPRWMHVPGTPRCSNTARIYCMER